jgi:AcrR family transcriptional regulator
MSTQPHTGADTRGRIIEAALGLIAEHGMTGVTMKAIAATAGVSRQTLYNHYSDVDAIVVESLEAHQKATLDELRAMLATIVSPSGRLEHLVRHSAAVGAHHHPIGILGQALSVEARSSLGTYEEDLFAIIAETLQSGIDAATFRPDIDVVRDARLIRHMLNAVAELTAANPEQAPDTVAAAIRTVTAAVTTSA